MPRKEITGLIEELRSWLPNYGHGPLDYPTVLYRILASAPGGDELADMGYEPFQLGWQELDQLGRVLVAIQDKRDVEDIVAGLNKEEEEDVGEPRSRRQAMLQRPPPPVSRPQRLSPAMRPIRPPPAAPPPFQRPRTRKVRGRR